MCVYVCVRACVYVCVCVCVCVCGWVGGWVGGCVGLDGWVPQALDHAYVKYINLYMCEFGMCGYAHTHQCACAYMDQVHVCRRYIKMRVCCVCVIWIKYMHAGGINTCVCMYPPPHMTCILLLI